MTRSALYLAMCLPMLVAPALVEASAWTYRGHLDDAGRPANGRYDLRLTLVDDTGTHAITQPVTLIGVLVEDGSFATDVDFGLDLSHAQPMKLRTEVAQGGSAFSLLGEPTRFDPKAALAGICWDTTGNVVAAGEFLGATNNVAVDIRSSNRRAARFESIGANNEVRVVLGSSANIATGVGATIGGGGSNAMTCGSSGNGNCANQTDETFATIAGGAGNSIVGTRGTVGGGDGNSVANSYGTTAGGQSNFSSGAWGAVGGGQSNGAQGQHSVVGGGSTNRAMGEYSTIGGGINNRAPAEAAMVGGGANNQSQGNYSTIAGGLVNTVAGAYATIAGGSSNNASGAYASIGGGDTNIAAEASSTVSGGSQNMALGATSSVAGGVHNSANGTSAAVGAGSFNCAGGNKSWAGGYLALIRSGNEAGDVTCGFSSADADGDNGTFMWADDTEAYFTSTGPNQFLVRASGGVMFNTATLPNASSDDMVIAARAVGSGGDADADVNWLSRAGKQGKIYLSDAGGGFVVNLPNMTAGTSRLVVNGGTGGVASLTNGGTWTNASSRAFKEGFAAVDAMDILAKLSAMPITRWTYKQSSEGTHLGPMAEDFKAAFDLAGDGKSISTVDADGVALAAIQGLNRKLESENAALRAEQDALNRDNRILRERLDAIEARLR